MSSTVLQFEVKNTSFTSHFSPLGIANCGKTLPGGRFKGRRRKTRRSKNCHSSPYSHITTTLSHSIAKTEKQVKTGRNSFSAKTELLPFPHYHLGRYICFPMFHTSLKTFMIYILIHLRKTDWDDLIHDTSPRLAIISTKMSMPLRKTDSWMNSL